MYFRLFHQLQEFAGRYPQRLEALTEAEFENVNLREKEGDKSESQGD